MTAGGARAKAAGKAAPAQNRRGSSCWSRKSRCCRLGTRSGIVRSQLLFHRLLRPRPRQRCPRLAHTATVALASLAIVIAATVVSQSAAAVALAATAIALAATACATLSLAAAVASVAFAFAFAAAAQPAQSASAALAALATVEGRGTSLWLALAYFDNSAVSNEEVDAITAP